MQVNPQEVSAEKATTAAAELRLVSVEQLQKIHRELDACQKVIWLAGCGKRGYGFDPAYVIGAQEQLKEIEALLAEQPQTTVESQPCDACINGMVMIDPYDGGAFITCKQCNGFAVVAVCPTCRGTVPASRAHLLAGHGIPPAVAGLVEALSQIERWDGFPSTGKTWPESGEPMSYSACFGSNGEREFMRQLAAQALATYLAEQGGAA